MAKKIKRGTKATTSTSIQRDLLMTCNNYVVRLFKEHPQDYHLRPEYQRIVRIRAKLCGYTNLKREF